MIMNREEANIAIIFPALNPENIFSELVHELRSRCHWPIIVVNDGSSEDSLHIFSELRKVENCIVLNHRVNAGKGRALKTAFNYALTHYPQLQGAVTADCDAQHTVDDIIKCAEALLENPDKLVLGVRNFLQKKVPWKSRFGNIFTCIIFRLLVNLKISDTQTGLRALPADFMETMLDKNGERFEFETVMLIESANVDNPRIFPIVEIPITTCYRNNNSGSHFRPITDSWQICQVVLRSVWGRMLLFSCSGLLAALLDQGLFALLYYWLLPLVELPGLLIPQSVARIFSLLFNYSVNRNLVFAAQGRLFDLRSFAGYLLLCAAILAASFTLLKATVLLMPQANVLLSKIVIDILLFLVSFRLQDKLIFKRGKSR